MAANYDSYASKISIDLGPVYDQAKRMANDLDAIETTWDSTMRWWNVLKLSWQGKTQQEVDQFQTSIDRVQKGIFGTTKADPNNPNQEVVDKPGLYQQVQEYALGAVQNYEWTDVDVATMFRQMSADATQRTGTVGWGPDGKLIQVVPSSVSEQQTAALVSSIDPTAGAALAASNAVAQDSTDPYMSETF